MLLSQPLSSDVDDIIEATHRLKLAGLVAKRRDSRYEPGVRSIREDEEAAEVRRDDG